MRDGRWARRGARSRARWVAVLLPCCLAGALYPMPVRFGVVSGQSMTPAFRHGQVFVMRRTGAAHCLRRGDVVVLALEGRHHIKRVHAVAGDIVSGVDWDETVGRPDYIADGGEMAALPDLLRRRPGIGRMAHVTVPEGCIFVVGDDVTRSCDSRHFGPVPLESVEGVVIASLFTLPREAREAWTLARAEEIAGTR